MAMETSSGVASLDDTLHVPAATIPDGLDARDADRSGVAAAPTLRCGLGVPARNGPTTEAPDARDAARGGAAAALSLTLGAGAPMVAPR